MENLKNFHWKLSNDRKFIISMTIIDILAVTFFIYITFLNKFSPIHYFIEYLFLTIFIVEYLINISQSENSIKELFKVQRLLDIIVILSFLPFGQINISYLRALRALRVLRLYRSKNRINKIINKHFSYENIFSNFLNLVIFIIIATGIVYSIEFGSNSDINNFGDALYFTITTVSTTGYGDITPAGNFGRMLSILIMLIGITLFFKLINEVSRPIKIVQKCKKCKYEVHDRDARYCKNCGRKL